MASLREVSVESCVCCRFQALQPLKQLHEVLLGGVKTPDYAECVKITAPISEHSLSSNIPWE
ncbi:ORF1145 [White spot syndrome virus]|uniref:ORF1145 n=1 Tax=White spot syndrome virus TaxID=342409 RepID=A0A2D3I706_9VIRU|nr:ORF1145 [White spot syndrome virus]